MDVPPALHPTDQTLQAFGLGKLDEPAEEAVSQHLESCPSCRRRVAELTSDTFLDHFRGARARPDPPTPIGSPIAESPTVDIDPATPSGSPVGTLPQGLVDHPDYEVLRELGQGGMGVVYLARNRLMARLEVLKVVGSHLVDRPGVMDRFLAEIRHAARLHHPNIVTAYSASRLGESLMLAMEYVEGLDLSKMVKSKGPLPVSHACSYVLQAALGLQHAHEHGMVHRDIKPSNLMIARQGDRAVVKVLDFGLAKVTREVPADGTLTHEGQLLGTPDYIAPEQTLDARRADIRADIYSLGCTLYYLLTGGPPFRGTTLAAILMAHHDREARPLNLVRPEVPVELAAVVARMMAKEPKRRFQTPKKVAQALKPFIKPSSGGPERSKPEISRAVGPGAGRQALGVFPESTQVSTDPPPLPVQAERKWSKPAPAHSAREPELPLAASGRRTPPWLWLAAGAAVLLLGLVIVWPAVSSKKTNLLDDRRTASPAEQKSPDEHPSGSVAAKAKGMPSDPRDWVPLFNGKDLTGWKTHTSQPGHWRVVDGVLIGGTSSSASHLYSERGDYRDIHLRIEARFNSAGSGGIYFRSSDGPVLPTSDPYWPAGYEALINTTTGRESNKTGTLDPGDPAHDDVWRTYGAPRTIPPGRWFTLEVIADGNILTTLLNGKTTAYHVDPKRRYVSGHLVLQQHDPQTVIEFRTIEVRELNRPGQKDPREIRRFVGHGTRVSQAAFSPDDGTILSGGSSEEVVTPGDGRDTRYEFGHSNTLKLWETDTGRPVGPAMKGHKNTIQSLAYSPDGRHAASTSHWWEYADKVVFVWDLTTGRRIHPFHFGTNGREEIWDWAVTFSADGRRVLASYSNGTVYEWDLKTEQKRLTIALGEKKWGLNEFSMLVFSPDGRHLISGNRHGVVELWDLKSGAHRQAFLGHTGTIRRVASSADGSRILVADSGNTVHLWNAAGGEEILSFQGDGRDLRCIAISPDGRRALSGGNDTIVRLWDLASGRELCQLQGHSMGVTCAAFSHDGRRAITGSDDGTIRLWDLPEPAPG